MGKRNNPQKKEWTWGYDRIKNSEQINEASIKNRRIEWWSEGYPGYANGYYSSQSIDDFLKKGPIPSYVPESVLKEMTETIKQIKESRY